MRPSGVSPFAGVRTGTTTGDFTAFRQAAQASPSLSAAIGRLNGLAPVVIRWRAPNSAPTLVPVAQPKYQIRALHTDSTVTVYQAYAPEIGLPAAREQRFPTLWQRDRMTWIKPSFLWMMYRCGWGTKEGQEAVLAVEISRDGFAWALENACLSSYEHGLHADRATWKRQVKRAPARAQWDPERDLRLRPLPHRSLQLGLTGEAARRYADEWTVSITDITSLAHTIHAHVRDGDLDAARQLLPRERPYPMPEGALAHLRQ